MECSRLLPSLRTVRCWHRLLIHRALERKVQRCGVRHDVGQLYVRKTPTAVTEPLPKRRAILALVQALHAAGVPATKLATVLPGNKLRPLRGRSVAWRRPADCLTMRSPADPRSGEGSRRRCAPVCPRPSIICRRQPATVANSPASNDIYQRPPSCTGLARNA
jgi:hypothetical protein